MASAVAAAIPADVAVACAAIAAASAAFAVPWAIPAFDNAVLAVPHAVVKVVSVSIPKSGALIEIFCPPIVIEILFDPCISIVPVNPFKILTLSNGRPAGPVSPVEPV